MNEVLAEKTFDWCIEQYGFSKHHDNEPWLDFSNEKLGMMGEYVADDNTMTIYKKYIKNNDDLIETIIHEYQHYLQSPTWMERYYNMGYEYDTHPYEIEAEEVVQKDKNKCKKYLNNA